MSSRWRITRASYYRVFMKIYAMILWAFYPFPSLYPFFTNNIMPLLLREGDFVDRSDHAMGSGAPKPGSYVGCFDVGRCNCLVFYSHLVWCVLCCFS